MRNNTDKMKAAFKVIWSLASGNNRSSRSNAFRLAIDAGKKGAHEPPFNRTDDVSSRFFSILSERGTQLGTSAQCAIPYWNAEMVYDAVEVFYTAIQFIDDHDAALPSTVLPPEKDVDAYLHSVLESEGRLLLPDQLERLLDITDNSIIGAANLGFITSRLLSRASDFRAYPGIDASLTLEDLERWNSRITRFDALVHGKTSDGPGDTYYFWTQFFSALYYRSQRGLSPKVADLVFAYGVPMMRFVRKVIARNPTLSHDYAAHMGRSIGLEAVKRLQNNR